MELLLFVLNVSVAMWLCSRIMTKLAFLVLVVETEVEGQAHPWDTISCDTDVCVSVSASANRW